MTHATFGEPNGIPEGSDFSIESVLTLHGAVSTSLVTSSGTYTVTFSDSVLNGGVALLTDEASDSVTVTGTGTRVTWNITDAQSSAWEAGVYGGDIKLVDSGGSITYWPCTIKIRTAKD